MEVPQDVSNIFIKLYFIFFLLIIAGGLASDELFLLDLKNGDNKAEWLMVEVKNSPTPGKRYGHSLIINHFLFYLEEI